MSRNWNINRVVWKEFKKSGKIEILSVEPLDICYYFNQLNYIKGTYIRKDKFKETLLRSVLKKVDEFIDLNYKPLNDDLLIRIDEWDTYKEWAHNQIGIPKSHYGR